MFNMFFGKSWSDMMEQRLASGQPAPAAPITILSSTQPLSKGIEPMPIMTDLDRRVAESRRQLTEMTAKFNARQAANERADTERTRMVREVGNQSFLEVSQALAADKDIPLTEAMRQTNRRYPALYTQSKNQAMVQYS